MRAESLSNFFALRSLSSIDVPHIRTNLRARDHIDDIETGASAAGGEAGAASRGGARPPEDDGLRLAHPSLEDGPHMWRLAGATGMDVNSPYAYTLWCRDFASTSVVARDGDRVIAYVTGYARPDSPDTYFLWQVAVDPDYRGRRLARRMLDFIGDRIAARGLRHLEATVTPDNTASRALFASFARDRGAQIIWSPLFTREHFPAGEGAPHEPEDLVRIGPLGPTEEAHA